MVITMYTPLTPRVAGRLAAPAVLAAMERSQFVGERERFNSTRQPVVAGTTIAAAHRMMIATPAPPDGSLPVVA
jgi:hypothetical protein